MKNESETAKRLNKAGQELLMTNCVTCHSPTAGIDNRLAPPMIAIKRHYIDDNVSQAQFADELIAFLKDPTEAKSKMPGAVKKFGLMAKLGYTDKQIHDVAEFIYHADIEQPDWFEEHYQVERGRNAELQGDTQESPTDRGLKYAMATKAILGKNLMNQITSNGTYAALSFCNEKAMHLTDSMAMAQSVSIKRVSDRPRNPDNRADETELDYIISQKERLANGENAESYSFDRNGYTLGYYPIMTNAMCLQCHGTLEETISPEVAAGIKEHYPQDEAIGYGENELRGIWVVEMEERSAN
jgi:cytochrome c553